MALNALRTNMVTFTGTPGIEVNGVIIGYKAEYTPRTSPEAKYNAITNLVSDIANTNQYYIQLGEQLYDGDLKLNNNARDDFGRPSRYWEYDGKEVGTYPKTELIRKEYSVEVTGKDLYDLLGSATIKDYDVDVYIDGEESQSVLGNYYFDADNMIRTNTYGVGGTGNGVLTQVFMDTQKKEITIAIINTYLAKAEEDYNDRDNDVDVKVFNIKETASNSNIYVKNSSNDEPMTIDGEDFDVKDVKEKDLYLVTVAQGVIQTMVKPEVLSGTTITSFKRTDWVNADGTKYDYASTARYDEEVLDQYDDKNMKNLTYNVVLDKYGYLIGLELNEEADRYVFLTGIDVGYSNLNTRNADANIIHLDGTMETVKVNVKDSELTLFRNASEGSNGQLNTWCTYSVSDAGVYTLDQVAAATRAKTPTQKAIKVAQSAQSASTATPLDLTDTIKINTKNTSLAGSGSFNRVYGNNDTVYLNVTLDSIYDKAENPVMIIDDVESTSTGVQKTDLLATELGANYGSYKNPVNEVYTLYKDNGYIIAAVVIGEDNGSASSFAYITGGVNQEDDNGKTTTRATGDGKYTWYRPAIVDGKKVRLTEVNDNMKVLDKLETGKWYELRYDADGNVRKVEESNKKDADRNDLYDGITFANANGKFVDRVARFEPSTDANFNTVLMFDTVSVNKLKFEGDTLYTDTSGRLGFAVSPDVKVVLARAGGNGDGRGADWFKTITEYEGTGSNGLPKALRDMNVEYDKAFTAGTVHLSALADSSGAAKVIVINDLNRDTGVSQSTDGSGSGKAGTVTWTSPAWNFFTNSVTTQFTVTKIAGWVNTNKDLTVSGEVWINGKYAGPFTNNTITATKDVPQYVTLGGSYTGEYIFGGNNVVELKNVQVDAQSVKVRILDQNNKVLSSGENPGIGNVGIGSWGNYNLSTITAEQIEFAYTYPVVGQTANYKVTGTTTEPAPSGTGAALTATPVNVGTHKAAGNGYVDIVLDMSGVTPVPVTYKVINSLSNDIKGAMGTTPTAVTLDKFGVNGATNDALEITLDTDSNIAKGGKVNFSAALSAAAADNFSYDVTVVTSQGNVELKGVKGTTAVAADLLAITADVEVTDVIVKANPIPKIIGAALDKNNPAIMTVTFNVAVAKTASGNGPLDDAIFALTSNNGVAISKVETQDNKTFTLTFGAAIYDGTVATVTYSDVSAKGEPTNVMKDGSNTNTTITVNTTAGTATVAQST